MFVAKNIANNFLALTIKNRPNAYLDINVEAFVNYNFIAKSKFTK